MKRTISDKDQEIFYAAEALRAFLHINLLSEIGFENTPDSEKKRLKILAEKLSQHSLVWGLIKDKNWQAVFQNENFLTGLNWLSQKMLIVEFNANNQLFKSHFDTLNKYFPDIVIKIGANTYTINTAA